MDWDAPAIVLEARSFADSDLIVTVLAAEHGLVRALARGAAGRAQRGLWQPGNLVQARWLGRLADQLGAMTAELAHPAAALVMADSERLRILQAALAVAAGALPEREPHPTTFHGLVRLVAGLAQQAADPADLVRWELVVLAELGYGLDLSQCALTGGAEDLGFVSPRTGRAVARAAAGVWASRLLPLPAFLVEEAAPAGPAAWRDGLRLSGHFLARDVFGLHNRPLPAARTMLYERIARLAAQETESHGR